MQHELTDCFAFINMKNDFMQSIKYDFS